MAFIEPILQEEKDRFVIFPIKHHDIWDWYKKMEANFCTTGQLDLRNAIPKENGILNDENFEFIKEILSNFIISYTAEKDFTRSFLEEIKYPEAKFFFDLKSVQDNSHLEKWSLVFNFLVKEKTTQDQIIKSAENLLSGKSNYIQKWIKSDSFSEKLIAFAAVERIFYSSSSCCIQLLKKEEFPQLSIFNDLIIRDKNLNSDFAVFLHKNHLLNKVPKVRIREILLEAFNMENEFISEYTPKNLNPELVRQHLKFVADTLLTEFECDSEFDESDPFDILKNNENPFRDELLEKRAGEMQKKGKNV